MTPHLSGQEGMMANTSCSTGRSEEADVSMRLMDPHQRATAACSVQACHRISIIHCCVCSDRECRHFSQGVVLRRP